MDQKKTSVGKDYAEKAFFYPEMSESEKKFQKDVLPDYKLFVREIDNLPDQTQETTNSDRIVCSDSSQILDSSCDSINEKTKSKNLRKQNLIFSEDQGFDNLLITKISQNLDEESHKLQKGNYLNFISTKTGSKVIQEALENTNIQITIEIFEEIENKLEGLMTHIYANYLCQKIYSFLPYLKKLKFLNRIVNNIEKISVNNIGTYSLQVLFDLLKSDVEKKIILHSLTGKVMRISLNSNGGHVVEKILNTFSESLNSIILPEIMSNFFLLANDVNGLCVVKTLIKSAKDIVLITGIRNILAENCLSLVCSPFGNYTLQIALEVSIF